MPMDENDSYLKPGMKDEKEPKGVTHGRPATGVARKRAALKKAALKKRNATAGWESMTGMTKAQKAAEMRKAGVDPDVIKSVLAGE